MDPTLRQLKTFVAIAQAGHVTRAAQQLNLSQPAVTHQMRQLEQALAAPLFRRAGRNIALTTIGENLLADIRPVIAGWESVVGRIRRHNPQNLQGVVRIATLQSYNVSIVVKAAQELALAHPGIRLVSREMPADKIEASVLAGRADIGLTFQHRPQNGLRSRVLAQEHLYAVFGAKLDLPVTDTITLADLQSFPLTLMPSEFALRGMVDDTAAALGLSLRIVFESSNLSALIAYADAASAVAIVPQFALPTSSPKRVRRLVSDAARQLSLIVAAGSPGEVLHFTISALTAAAGTQDDRWQRQNIA